MAKSICNNASNNNSKKCAYVTTLVITIAKILYAYATTLVANINKKYAYVT